jgi:hypothetical protein
MPSGVFCSHRYHFNSCIGVLVMSGSIMTVYLFSLCIVSLLSSKFTARALVWFSNFFKYLVVHFFISLSTAVICGSSWIPWLIIYQGAFRIDRRVLD